MPFNQSQVQYIIVNDKLANPVPKEINVLNLFENIIIRMATPFNIVWKLKWKRFFQQTWQNIEQ